MKIDGVSRVVQIPPACLWVGAHDFLVQRTIEYLQRHFCVHGGCGACRVCLMIGMQQHHGITWLTPQKTYTVDQLHTIFNTMSFMLELEDHHFFVIQRADLLTAVCANSLLKSLEEPSAGYHFILLAERIDQLLPTVRSRCIVDFVYTEKGTYQIDELFCYFSLEKKVSLSEFLKVLDQSKITDQESIPLLDRLLTYWIIENKRALCTGEKDTYQRTEKIISILKNAYRYAPMPGSSKLFWKHIFLQMLVA